MKTKTILLAAFAFIAESALAQTRYQFHCSEFVSTDNSRAPQSVFTYDRQANTLSINASGSNNVAFEMAQGADGEYFIENDQTLFLICGQNLQMTASSAVIWWINGYHNGADNPSITASSGSDRFFVWDLKAKTTMSPAFDFTQEQITISGRGTRFMLAAGLTALRAGMPGLLKDISYYAPYEAACIYPNLMTRLNFTETTLTQAVKEKVEAMMNKMQTMANDETVSFGRRQALTDAIGQARMNLAAVDEDDYSAAYAIVLSLRSVMDAKDSGTHTGSWEKAANGMKARFDDQYISITFYNDSIVRICKTKDADYQRKSWVILQQPEDGLSIDYVEKDDTVTLSTPKLHIIYNVAQGVATVLDAQGRQLISEQGHEFVATKDGPFDSYTLTQDFRLDDDERIYGMGQLQDGMLNRRGTSVLLEQDNRRIAIPYFLSSKNYSLYWDNYSPTTFTDASSGTRFRSTGTAIDYYVLSADDKDGVQRSLRSLTGQCELPPLWNFGVYQSKERYTSAQEVMDVLKRYREQHIPIDCMVQDWQYWGDDAHWNAMEFLNPTYSNYQEMIDYVHDQHAKLMISIWTTFGPETKPFAEFQEKGLLLPGNTWPLNTGSRIYDLYSSQARDIYWRYLYNGIVNKGIDAYWLDMTDPEFFGEQSDFDHVSEYGETWRSLRNVFPLATVEGVANHHRAQPELSDKRTSILTRCGFLGMQRTGAFIWSADITASWDVLRNQIAAACNVSVSGLPYWNSDTGGFFLGRYKNGVNDPAFRRLYTRWTQFSCFTPMLRFHGTGTPQEPWQFGSEGDTYGEYDNIVKYIRLRYALLPYIYATANRVRTESAVFMDAIPLAFPDDKDGWDVSDEYMFGQSFLVAPIVQDGVIGRDVYLPGQTTKWIDFWTGYTYDGGQSVFKKAPADVIPLYVKAGSILPIGPDVQYSTEKPWDALELRIYPGADGEFTLYEDAFEGYGYEQGQFTEIPMHWDEAAQTLTIGERRGGYDGMLTKRKFHIVVVTPGKGTGDQRQKEFDEVVTYKGKTLTVRLKGGNTTEPATKDLTQYIENPSFEDDGKQLTKVAPKGWTVESQTWWWGVNPTSPGAIGDPVATDGKYIFGVWDSQVQKASISQVITGLPKGDYRLCVDMQATNQVDKVRTGEQCVFAGEQRGLFRDQVRSVGVGDECPMQTIHVDFTQEADDTPLTIGVMTDNAPEETWFKIDNFRLYPQPDDVIDAITQLQASDRSLSSNHRQSVYNLQGQKVADNKSSLFENSSTAKRGIYITNGKKYVVS